MGRDLKQLSSDGPALYSPPFPPTAIKPSTSPLTFLPNLNAPTPEEVWGMSLAAHPPAGQLRLLL